MLARITNRDRADASERRWYQIDVAGRHPGRLGDREIVQQIDAGNLSRIVNTFAAERESAGERWPGLLIDRDHLSHDPGQATEAMGWLRDLEVRPDGLYGLIDWTDTGAAAIRNKRYKFFSTEYAGDEGDLQWAADGRTVSPLRLVGLALTNRPNNRGGQPISNRDTTLTPQHTTPTHPMIAEKLGLAPEATEEEIKAALDAMLAELDEYRSKSADMEAEEILNRHAARIPEGKRDELKALLLTNREPTEQLLALLPEPAKAAPAKVEPQLVPPPITNRQTARTPGERDDDARQSDEARRSAIIRNRAHAIQAAEGVSWSAAWNRAAAETA